MQQYDSLFAARRARRRPDAAQQARPRDRIGYLNARNTLLGLLEMGVVPIVNENDAVAIDEIAGAKIGDNDNLSALVANLIDADLLALLTDTGGLLHRRPAHAQDGDAHRAHRPRDAGDRGDRRRQRQRPRHRRHGDETAGRETRHRRRLRRLHRGRPRARRAVRVSRTASTSARCCPRARAASRAASAGCSPASRRRARSSSMRAPAKALTERSKSLLPAGVRDVQGPFKRGDTVNIVLPDGQRDRLRHHQLRRPRPRAPSRASAPTASKPCSATSTAAKSSTATTSSCCSLMSRSRPRLESSLYRPIPTYRIPSAATAAGSSAARASSTARSPANARRSSAAYSACHACTTSASHASGNDGGGSSPCARISSSEYSGSCTYDRRAGGDQRGREPERAAVPRLLHPRAIRQAQHDHRRALQRTERGAEPSDRVRRHPVVDPPRRGDQILSRARRHRRLRRSRGSTDTRGCSGRRRPAPARGRASTAASSPQRSPAARRRQRDRRCARTRSPARCSRRGTSSPPASRTPPSRRRARA